MARYIDADVALRLIELDTDWFGYSKRDAKACIKATPTADVAPRSEVDLYRKQVDELEDELASTYDKLETAKTEIAREIFEEIEKLSYRFMNDEHYIFGDMVLDIDELKKKYTEGDDPK